MLGILVFLYLTFSSTPLLAQPAEIEERLKKIEDHVERYQRVQKLISKFNSELNEFDNPKLTEPDKVMLKTFSTKTKEALRDLDNHSYLFNTESIRTDLEKLKKRMAERALYKKYEKDVEEIEKRAGNSKTLQKYIQQKKNDKEGRAKVSYLLLNAEEKRIAKQYEEAHVHLIKERYMQKPVEDEIVELSSKINDHLLLPESAVLKSIEYEKTLNENQEEWTKLQSELSLDQYEFELKAWDMGLFKCESKAQYLRPKSRPDLLMLLNEGNLRSVITLDPTKPKDLNVSYKCKEMAPFGTCLDNSKKELCYLDPSCKKSLIEAESNYKRDKFFVEIKSEFPPQRLRTLQRNFAEKKDGNVINVFEDLGKLGLYSRNELIKMMDPIISLSQTINAQTPEEYQKKMKAEIEKRQANIIKELSSKFAQMPGDQIENTKNVVRYIFVSMNTELENILKDETIQEFVYENCSEKVGNEAFCRATLDWKNKVTIFDDTEEVYNLTPNECPRVVLRLDRQISSDQVLSCDPLPTDSLDELAQSINLIQSKFLD